MFFFVTPKQVECTRCGEIAEPEIHGKHGRALAIFFLLVAAIFPWVPNNILMISQWEAIFSEINLVVCSVGIGFLCYRCKECGSPFVKEISKNPSSSPR